MGLPADVTTITVTGTFLDALGNPASGTVTFDPAAVLTDTTGKVVLGAPVTVTLNASGHFSITLPCTDNNFLVTFPGSSVLAAQGWAYALTITGVPGVARQYALSLPHSLGASVDLSALI